MLNLRAKNTIVLIIVALIVIITIIVFAILFTKKNQEKLDTSSKTQISEQSGQSEQNEPLSQEESMEFLGAPVEIEDREDKNEAFSEVMEPMEYLGAPKETENRDEAVSEVMEPMKYLSAPQ